MTGTTIGHYQILEKLGEGGMGEVYKARDVLLNRTAALKFLPADSAGDKRHRFVQEAQSASALNHPNIITIYEVATAGARDFIAMELVQGQTLDEIIASKPLPLERVLTYGVQIADALAAAHAAGLCDLKPGNVMVTDSGMVKVLDFGLAKLMAGASSPSGVSETVLAGAPRTVEGTILGTVAYMSPEQAEGKPVDHRSDIFSFGAVLLEMLTGHRAFHGESTASTRAAILTAEPPSLSMDVPGVPVELIRIISRCLRKQPDKRWQNIADVRIALEELKQDLESGRLNAPRAAAPPVPQRWWPLVAAGLVAAALTGVIVWSMRPSVPAPELWSVVRLTSDAGASLFPAISRDGKLVTYVSDRAASDTMDLWVQQIEGGDPVQLTRGLGACRDPAFSPDGTRIAAYCGADPGGVYIVPALGGLPRKIAEGEWPRFSPDGSKIRIRDLATGTDQRLAEAKEWSYLVLSPDSSQVAFSSDQRPKSAIYSVPAAGGVPRRLCGGCGRPVEWIADRTKLLIDNAGPNERDIHILDVATGQSKPLLQHSEFQLTMPRLSPDGKVMSFTQVRPGQARRIYLVPFTGELVPEQEWSVLLDASTLDRQPAWAPAGSTLYFLSDRDGARCIWAQRVDTTTRRPVGSPFAAHHMHQFRYNLKDVDPASIGLSLADGQMFYASFDLESNIWLAERRERTAR